MQPESDGVVHGASAGTGGDEERQVRTSQLRETGRFHGYPVKPNQTCLSQVRGKQGGLPGHPSGRSDQGEDRPPHTARLHPPAESHLPPGAGESEAAAPVGVDAR